MKEEINLIKIVEIILRQWWIVLLFAVVTAFATFAVNKLLIPAEYTSTAKVYVDGSQRTSTNGVNLNDLNTNARLVSTYVEILCSDSFLSRVSKNAKTGASASDIKANIEMGALNNTEVLEIKYTDGDTKDAQKVLQELLYSAQEEITRIMPGCKVNIVDNADLPTSPSAPNVRQNTFVGLLAGLVIGVAVIFLKELLDTRIKEEDELKEKYNIAVLGVIPNLDEE